MLHLLAAGEQKAFVRRDRFAVDAEVNIRQRRFQFGRRLHQLTQEFLETVAAHRLAVDEIRLLENLLDGGRQRRVEAAFAVERVGLASRPLIDQILHDVLMAAQASVVQRSRVPTIASVQIGVSRLHQILDLLHVAARRRIHQLAGVHDDDDIGKNSAEYRLIFGNKESPDVAIQF